MTVDDLDTVMEIEKRVYTHPWTRGNFSDSLAAGYHCWIMESGGETVGYSVIMVAEPNAVIFVRRIILRLATKYH